MNIVLCNSCLSTASNDRSGYGTSVLNQIVNKCNPFIMLLDKSGRIGEAYEEVIMSEDDDYLQVILQMIADNDQYKSIDIIHDFTDNCYVNTLINAPFSNLLFTTNLTNFIGDTALITSHRIQIKDEQNASACVNGQRVYTKPPLLEAIVSQLTSIMGHKLVTKIEDWHTADLRNALRGLDFEVFNTSKGVSDGKKQEGELDLYVSENGLPVSVIEALRESSCGDANTNISSHLNKLLNYYDCWGVPENFLITYYEGADLKSFWKKYKNYMSDINVREEFSNDIPQKKLVDISAEATKFSDIKVAKGVYERSGQDVIVYHIVCNMYVPT